MTTQKTYIQVGVTALKTPTGGYYPSIPLFIETENLTASSLIPVYENALTDFAGFFIEKYGEKLKQKESPLKVQEAIRNTVSFHQDLPYQAQL